MKKSQYIHGYSNRESLRLNDQAETLEDIIHNDSIFDNNSLVLEAGCGVGAQTKIIAKKNPKTSFISVDISEVSLKEAKEKMNSLNIDNVEFKQGDIYNLSFENETFDYVFICFVLEHLKKPKLALSELKRVLKYEGIMMAIEEDHGSTFFYPDSNFAHSAINCQIQLQKDSGGNSNIGRELYPLLSSVGLSHISVSPRVVYVDSSKPKLVEGFILNTFAAMIQGVGEEAITQGLIDGLTFEKEIQDLYRTTGKNGVFSYTFFKGFGIKE